MNNIMDMPKEKTTKATTKQGQEYLLRIPKDPENKNDNIINVCINSKIEVFERGKEYKVSPTVKNILERANYI